MTITVPGVVVSDEAILAAIRVNVGEPELELYAVDGVELDDIGDALTAAAPYLIRDWARAVLADLPYITPRHLRELADGLLPEGTP